MLAFTLSDSSKMQIWDTKNYTIISELSVKSVKSSPAFLKKYDNRLILCEDHLIDGFTGNIIFQFSPKEGISSYFYDYKFNKYFYISDTLQLCQFNSECFESYLFEYLDNDSLLSLKNDVSIVCNRKMSIFPYFFTHLHLIAVYDKSEDFVLDKIKEKYPESSSTEFLRMFYSVDIFKQTPLDILLQRKNTTLIMKYFKMLFEVMKIEDFYSRARFFHYEFRENYTILSLLCELMPLLGDDLSLLSDVLNHAFISFDSSIYDDSLIFEELDDPIVLESDSMYNDKSFIEKKLNQYLNKDDNDEDDISKSENSKKNKKMIEEKMSIVKAKILCIPNISDYNCQETKQLFDLLARQSNDNNIFTHEILSLLVNFVWETQISVYYKIEFYVFFFFFVLFNINFSYLLQERELHQFQAINLSIVSGIIDTLIFSYSIFTFVNEVRQFIKNLDNYFKSIWNYVDILLIPTMIFSSAADLMLHFINFVEILSYIKVIFAFCMSLFWFRLLSFSRGIKETSSMIRLIFNVISGVKFFALFMFLFMLNFSSSLYILRDTTDDTTDNTFWGTFLDFYFSAVGDTSGLEAYNILFPIQNIYKILATFLFAIIAVNLLVSIIGDKHNENNDNEAKTRIYELLNIIVDTDISLVTAIARWIKPNRKNGRFLIRVFNEKHEQKEGDTERILENLKNISTTVGKLLAESEKRKEDAEKYMSGLRKSRTISKQYN